MGNSSGAKDLSYVFGGDGRIDFNRKHDLEDLKALPPKSLTTPHPQATPR